MVKQSFLILSYRRNLRGGLVRSAVARFDQESRIIKPIVELFSWIKLFSKESVSRLLPVRKHSSSLDQRMPLDVSCVVHPGM